MSAKRVKQEPDIAPEGLVPRAPTSIPVGFEAEEWKELTEGWDCEDDEIDDVLAQRGTAGSKKGRPTNLRVPHKGALSDSARAIAQRDRAALLSVEEKALDNAKSGDRQARAHMKKRLDSIASYSSASEEQQAQMLAIEQEKLDHTRYESKRSAEWLNGQLSQVHKKWAHIYTEVEIRQHHNVVAKAMATSQSSATQSGDRSLVRLYGSGGVLEELMRREYDIGLAKLTSNTFESEEAKEVWKAFRDDLSPKDWSVVLSKDWEKLELPSVVDVLGLSDDTKLRADKDYYAPENSDECEEEVDDDSEIDEYYENLENEYETHEQWEEACAELKEESEWEGFSDLEEGSGESDGLEA